MRPRDRILTVTFSAIALVGCATPDYRPPDVATNSLDSAASEIENAEHLHVRNWTQAEAENKTFEIYERLLPAAREICATVGEHSCNWTVRYSPDLEFNAYAAGDHEIVINQGILRYAQSDDEVAMVVAHELAHHSANHIQETHDNMVTGAVVGGLIAAVVGGIAAHNGVVLDESFGRAAGSAIEAGGTLGAVGFSKGQENEADYLAAYMLERGGFDLGNARNAFVTMGRFDARSHPGEKAFDTHPSPAERLATWDATMAQIHANSGVLSKRE